MSIIFLILKNHHSDKIKTTIFMSENNLSFKQAYEELREINESFKNGSMDIDNLLAKLKRAKELLDFCKNKLRTIEDEIKANEEPNVS